MKKYSLGIDIGGTTVKLGLFTVDGELLKKWEIETKTSDKGKYILEDISKSIDETLNNEKIEKEDVLGIGVGVPGPVKGDGTVNGCVNLGWGILNVSTELGKLTGLSVKVANDANIAALGEMFKGGGKGYSNLIMLTLGTGVGGAVIIDGKVIPGANGAGGEIGHINVNPHESIACNCGRKGCLEQYTSATGIARIGTEVLGREVTAKDVFDLAKENDELAIKVINKFSSILGRAISNISCICDPEVYVIGGGVSKAGDILVENLQKHYELNSLYATKGVEFKLATLGNDAGIYGGAKLIQEIL